MKVGDILVFRGDFVHAGSKYKTDNYRLHVYLDSDFVPRTPNQTWVVHKDRNSSIKRIIKPK